MGVVVLMCVLAVFPIAFGEDVKSSESSITKFEEELKQIENEEFDIKLLEQFIQRRNEAAYKSNENNTIPEIPEKINYTVNEVRENSAHLFEGDILLTRKQVEILSQSEKPKRNKTLADLVRGRNIASDLTLRWKMPVSYTFSKGDGVDVRAIEAALDLWRENTCVTFVRNDKPSATTNYIKFFKGGGCYSSVGMTGGEQTSSIGDGCEYIGISAHEIGHALGLWHEQSRPDRDEYVTILENNIVDGVVGNFAKFSSKQVATFGFPYDLGSVMHYAPTSFAKFINAFTIQTKDPNFQSTPGQREELSFYDIKLINTAYCDKTCEKKLPCQRNGYTDPKDCSRCRCPAGLDGIYCEKPQATASKCGLLDLNATDNWQTISAMDINQCNWLIRNGGSGQKIRLKVTNWVMGCQRPTCTSYFVEFRYGSDLANTGARMCCGTPAEMVSKLDEVLILYRGTFANSFTVKYKLDSSTTSTVPSATTKISTTNKVTASTPTTRAATSTPTTRAATSTPIARTTPRLASSTTSKVTIKASTQKPTLVPISKVIPTTIISNVGWTEWSGFSNCTQPCGGCGYRVKSRQCLGGECRGYPHYIERCEFQQCPGVTPCCNPYLLNPKTGICTDAGVLRSLLQVFSG